MDKHEYIYSTLSSTNYPVEYDTYTGKQKKYITYFEILEKVEFGSDDTDEIIGHHFQVDIFSDEDPTEMKNEVIEALKNAGFSGITCQDLYEPETKTYHKAIDCYIAEYKE